MKLHLPQKLTAALIAAITTVGFTLTQAQAAWEGGANEGSEYYTNTGRTNLHLTNTSDALITFTAEQNHVTAGIAELVVKDLATVRVRGGNHWGNGRAFDMLTIDSIKAGDGSGTVFVNAEKYDNGQAASNSTATVLGINGTLGGVQNYGVLTLGADGGTINASGAIMNNSGATLTLNGTYTFDTADAMKYTLREEGSVTWTDEAKEQGFKKTYGSSYYIIKGATAGTGFQATTTTGATVSEESAGTYYFTAGDVTDTTKFYVKTDAVTLEGVNGTGTFQVDKAGATVTVQDATYRVTTGNMNLNIVINDQGVLETTHSGDCGFITGSLTINAGGIMRIVGQHDAFGWGSKNQCVASLTMKGEEGKLATLELNQTTNYSATMVTDVNMQGYSTITSTKQGGSAGFNTFGCNITASGVQNNIDVLDVRRSGVTIDVAEDGELTVGKLTINGSDHSASSVVVKQGEGTLYYTGETRAMGLDIRDGTVVLNGTTTIDGNFTVGGNATIENNGILAFGGTKGVITLTPGCFTNTGTVTFSTSIVFDLSQLTPDENNTYTLFTGPVDVDLSTYGFTAGNITGVAGTDDYYWTFGVDGTVRAANYAMYEWTGIATTWRDGGGGWIKEGQPATYLSSSGADVIFAASAEEGFVKDISVNTAVAARNVNIQDDYTFNFGERGRLSAEKLIIDEGCAPTITGVEGEKDIVSIGTLSGSGNLKVGANGTITVTTLGEYTGKLAVANGGTLNMGSAIILPDLTVEHGTVITSHAGSTGIVSNTLTIGEDGTFKVIGQHDAFGYDNGATKNIVMQGAEDHLATLALEQTTTNSVTMTTNIAMHGYSAITSMEGTKGFNTYGGNITVDGVENSIAVIDLRNEVTIDVAEDGTLDVSKVTRYSSGTTRIVNKVGRGILTFTGDAQMSGLNVEAGTAEFIGGNSSLDALSIAGDGTLNIIGADTIVTAEGSANTLSSTINVDGATLNLNGTFAIDDNNEDMRVSYSGGLHEGNGFKTASGEIVVYTAANGANVTFGNAAQITYAGVDVKDELVNGVYTAEEETFYSTFHVNSGTENVSQAQMAAGMENIVLKNDTTLNVDADFASSRIGIAIGTATVNIGTGQMLAGTIQNAIITGSGTYALNSGTPNLGTNTVLDENWTGTVRIGGFSASSSTHLDSFANGSASTVEIYGITSGYLPEYSGGTVGANIKLTNPGSSTPAWIWSSGGSYTITFSGDWSGDGTFRKSGSYNQSFAFSGDISEWRGAFEFSSGSSYTTNLTFKGNATEVNAAISKPGAGTLNIMVGDGQSDFDTTFGNNVTASSLQVMANASATMAGTTTLNSVTLASDALLENTGTMTLNGRIVFGNNAIQNNGTGTIAFGSGTVFDLVNLTPGGEQGNVYTLFSGSSAVDLSTYGFNAGNITGVAGKDDYFWTFGVDGTVRADNYAMYVWAGTATTWSDGGAGWIKGGQPATYVSSSGADVTFVASAEEGFVKDIAVNTAVAARNVYIQDDYTFVLSEFGRVQGESVTIMEGTTLTVQGTGTLAVNQELQGQGSLALGAGTTATVARLSVGEDQTFTVEGEGAELSVSTLSNAGTLNIGTGARVDVGNSIISVAAGGSFNVSGQGTLAVETLRSTGGALNISNALEVRGGGDGTGSANRSLGLAVTNAAATVTLAGDTHITGALYNQVGTVNIGNGTDAVRVETNRVEFGDTAGTGTSTLNVNKNATLHVRAGDATNAYASTGLILGEWNGVSTANIAGKLYADNATAYVGDSTVTFNIQKGGLMAVKGFSQNQFKAAKTETINLNLLEGGTLVLGENGIDSQKPINVCLEAGELGISADSVTIAKDVELSGGATTFNTAKYVWEGANDTRELVKGSEGGTMTVSGNITGEGSLTKTGAGSLVLSGTNNVLTHTIAANEGSMTLYGSYEIGDIALVGTTVYGDGVHEGNGYATATGTITVFSGDATVTATDATFTYHGSTVTVTNGVYTLPGTQDTTTYYINEDTDSYGWIDTHKKGDLVFGIVVKAGATLQADKDMSMAALAAPSKGTVDIDDGVVVTAAGGTQAVKITGAGTYALASGEQTLGSVNADDYGGYVRLSGNIVDINLDGNLQGKNVELSGVSGYFKNVDADSQAVFNGNLRMSDVNGTPAITVTTGYSRDRAYLVFSGAVSGNGTWELNCGATQHYVFSGDISAWDGTFHVTRSGASYGGTSINFCGDAKEVNASIIKLEAGTLNLIVGDGQSSFTTTFKNTVEASSLTVQKHATAILGGDATISDSLTLHGLLKTDGGSLSLGDHATVQIGAAMSMEANKGGEINVSDNTAIEADRMYGKDEYDKGVLNNVNVDILDDYTIENMSISGSLIDVGEGTKLYLVNVDIKSDTHITDEAAWLDMQATNAWLDENNAHVMGRHVTTEDTTLYLSGDPSQAITMAAGRVVVELTSDMFDTVTMTGGEPGVDLWLDMTAIADAFEGADYVALDFRNLAREFSNAMVDVEKLQVNVTLDGETYKQAYAMTDHGTTTTLYFAVPEPTTSTLSLLALAALAARRRRK